MIFRLAAIVIEAWCALVRTVRSLWRAVPGDLLGLLVLRACGIAGPGRHVAVGDVTAIVAEDPRAAHYLDVMPIRPYAQTLGRYVVARAPMEPAMLVHELEHVGQWGRLGPLFLPAYLLSSGLALLRGQHPYRANAFEAAARAAAERAPLQTAASVGAPQAPCPLRPDRRRMSE